MAGFNEGDSQVRKSTPPSGDGLNGADLLSQHKEVVGKNDKTVAGNPNFEVAESGVAAPAGHPASGHRLEVAALTGGDPGKPDALLANRQEAFLAGQAAIASISTPEQGQALMGQLNDQTAAIQARIKALAAIQSQYA